MRLYFYIFLLTSKPVRRLAQASLSPLLSDWTFWITVLIIVRCSSSMEAPPSTSSRLSGTSGWTEAVGSEGLLLLEGVRLPRSGTVEDSGAVSGTKPNLEPWGVLSPLLLGSGRSPCGSSRTTSSCPGACYDATSASSALQGETAGGTEFMSDESREPLDESSGSARGELHNYIRH